MNASDRLHLEYCAKDCAVTFECRDELTPRLSPGQRRHYEFNKALTPAVLYMELRGMRYDGAEATRRLRRVEKWIAVLQGMLNRAAGVVLPRTEAELVTAIKQAGLVLAKPRRRYEVITPERMLKNGKVKAASSKTVSEPAAVETLHDCVLYAKDSGSGAINSAGDAFAYGGVESSFASNGRCLIKLHRESRLASALGVSINVNSTNAGGDSQRFLYQICWTPKMWVKGEGWREDWEGWGRASALERDLSPKIPRSQADASSTSSMEQGDAALDWPIIPHQDEQTIKVDVEAAAFQRLAHCRMLFPRQYAKDGNRVTDRLTTNDAALLRLWVLTQDKRVKLFLRLRALHTATETLRASADPDGRIRCGLIIPGTKTGRFACHTSPTGSGYNLQTVRESMRDLFLADEGCLLGQADLRGSDGWTIAAECKALGDPTMMEDLEAGLKPAHAVVLMCDHGESVNSLPRAELLRMASTISKGYWLYGASKAGIWSFCYGAGAKPVSAKILKESYKATGHPLHVPVEVCERIRQAVFTRYPGIERRMQWIKEIMGRDGVLTSSLGFKRAFHGWRDFRSRPSDAEATRRDMLAHMPQVMTTGATKMALLRLWTDPENWARGGEGLYIPVKCDNTSEIAEFEANARAAMDKCREQVADEHGQLRVEPLLTVHDSLIDQFIRALKEWARMKHRQWFNNPLRIAGSELVIGFDGTIGADWGMRRSEKI